MRYCDSIVRSKNETRARFGALRLCCVNDMADVDLDATLPLAMDVQADSFEDGCRHLLDLLLQPPSTSSSDELLSVEEGASLLSHLTILHRGYCRSSGNDNVASSTTTVGPLWSPTSVNLVRATVRLVMTSLRRRGGGGVDRVMTVDGKMARRLLTDGILPLASSSYSSHSSSPTTEPLPCVWLAKLIRSIVMEDILPSIFLPTDDTDNGGNNHDHDATNANNDDTTTIEILLSPFLIRMDTDELSQILPVVSTATVTTNSRDEGEGGGGITTPLPGSVDDVLDQLCGVVVATGGEEQQQQQRRRRHRRQTRHPHRLRSSYTAVILAALREFEVSTTHHVGGGRGSSSGGKVQHRGRLSHRRIWKVVQEGSRRRPGSTMTPSSRYECSHEYVDRPTYLLRNGLYSLRSIIVNGHHRTSSSSSRRGGVGDTNSNFDALPPLVYQLGLLPMGLTSSSSSSSGGGGGQNNESEKHRGMRLRRMCLGGIANALDDDDYNHTSIARSSECSIRRDDKRLVESYRWARYTSLSHLGNCLRSDPELCKAMLSLLAGETTDYNDDNNNTIMDDHQSHRGREHPFRYGRITPFKLAMGLSMASSVPRMRTMVLNIVRDLILEEETLRVRRRRSSTLDSALFGGGKDMISGAGASDQPWMDCLVRCLEENVDGDNPVLSAGKNKDGISIVLQYILSVAKFAEGEDGMAMAGMIGGGGGVSGGCASSLLQSLSQLGFILVDCVKKNDLEVSATSVNHTTAMLPTTVLASNLDISSFGGSSSASDGNSSTARAVATIGRFLLCYLFYQSSSSRFSSSSNSLSSSIDSGGGDTAFCRSIVRTSFDKFCGMAPNALEHATLLLDLLRFRPSSIGLNDGDENENNINGDERRDLRIALVLATNHLPSIIDTLAGVSSGGMSPIVASQTIVPTIGRLLLLMATASSSPALRRGLVTGSLWKRHDLEDHVNQTFLLAKKCLFVHDVEKRKFAARLLVTIIGVSAVAASSSGNSRGSSMWSSILCDIKCSLLRSLSQHQEVVRTEIYSSLLELLPKSVPSPASSTLSAATQESTSPGASTTSGQKMPSPKSSSLGSYHEVIESIPISGQKAIIGIVSELLLSSLERYITIPKEEPTDRKARQQRAALGAGLSQPDIFDEEEESSNKKKGTIDASNPFRFEKLINTRLSSLSSGGSGVNDTNAKKTKAKSLPIGQSLLLEAMDRINEPLAFLLASSLAVLPLLSSEDKNDCDDDDDDDDIANGSMYNSDRRYELKKSLIRIRSQMGCCSDVEDYLQWIKTNKVIFDIKDNAKRSKEMAISKLATLLLVSLIADVLIGACKWEKGNIDALVVECSDDSDAANDVENLFTLRMDAMSEATVIMSSFVMKPKKSIAALEDTDGKTEKTKKKKLRNIDANKSSQSSDKPTAGGKSSTLAGEAVFTKVKSSDINDVTLAKNRRLIEAVLDNISPAINHEFLAEALRRAGAEASKKVPDDDDSDNDNDNGEDDNGATARLAKCLIFRRYIITKSLLLMSGSSSIVKGGSKFGPLPLRKSTGLATSGMDEKSASKMRIAVSLSLGPLIFVEFCTHCYELDRTSITMSTKASNSDISLAQLALRVFTCCVRGMTFDAPNHALSKSSRVNALLTGAIRKTSTAIPCSADGWNHHRELNSNELRDTRTIPGDEVNLLKSLLPILSLAQTDESNDGSCTHICLFSELLLNHMYGEAMECCYLISSAAEAFDDPNCRQRMGVHLLRAFEFVGAIQAGVLGLDHSDESNEVNICVSAAVSVAMKLNCGLDGNTSVPLSVSDGISVVSLRAARSKMGLPTSHVEDWPKKHQQKLQKELLSSGMIGIPTQIAWALSATLDIGKNFVATFDKNSPSKKQLKLAVIKAASLTSSANFVKEKASIAYVLSLAIDGALDNADYVTLKMVPQLSQDALDLTQRFVSSLLFSVCKMISASAPSSEFLIVDGSFSSTLLKSSKRLYGICAKLIISFMANPDSLSSKEMRNFLDYLTATFLPRVSALLFTLQEQETAAGGKFLAESKIASHGKTSAMLVFEKEKLDSALLKVSAKLKQSGLDDESEWLENHVVSNLNRDFVIKRVEDAKAREAPKTKKVKRVVKAEKSSSKARKKRAKLEIESDVDDDDDNDIDEETDDKAPKKKQSSRKLPTKMNRKKQIEVEEESDDNDDDNDDEASIMEVDADESMDGDDDDEDVISLSKLTADMADDSDEEESDSEGEKEYD